MVERLLKFLRRENSTIKMANHIEMTVATPIEVEVAEEEEDMESSEEFTMKKLMNLRRRLKSSPKRDKLRKTKPRKSG